MGESNITADDDDGEGAEKGEDDAGVSYVRVEISDYGCQQRYNARKMSGLTMSGLTMSMLISFSLFRESRYYYCQQSYV